MLVDYFIFSGVEINYDGKRFWFLKYILKYVGFIWFVLDIMYSVWSVVLRYFLCECVNMGVGSAVVREGVKRGWNKNKRILNRVVRERYKVCYFLKFDIFWN